MRIFCVSDLHRGHGPANDAAIDAMARHVGLVGREDDVLLAIGDHAADDTGIVECLSLFRDFRGTKLAVAGNHDVWVPPGGDSFRRYLGLTEVFRSVGFHPLEVEPYRVGRTAFVGSMGWYDYSFRDRIGVASSAYTSKVFPGDDGPMWNDATFVNWGFTDAEMTDFQAARLEQHLDTVTDAERVIAAIHHVPTKRLLVQPRMLVPKRWRFANAFLGSERFRSVFERHDSVHLVVNGHIHLQKTRRLNGTTYASIGGGYGVKQLLVTDGRRIERTMFHGRTHPK